MKSTIQDITAAQVREVLDYEPVTGNLVWRKPVSRSVKVGDIAGTTKDNGYMQVRVGGRKYYAHRLVWLHVHGCWPSEIDHINGVRSDNRIANLRDIAHAENCQNIRQRKPSNKVGLLGVDRRKGSGKYRAAIKLDDKQIHIGHFSTAEDAHAAYVAAKRQIHAGCTI